MYLGIYVYLYIHTYIYIYIGAPAEKQYYNPGNLLTCSEVNPTVVTIQCVDGDPEETGGMPLEVVPADIQGFANNAVHYATSVTMRRSRNVKSRPLFLRQLPLDALEVTKNTNMTNR